MSKEYQSRSQFIEMILQSFVAKRKREERDARELAIINQNAERFNRETAEFLAFMGELHEAV
jgi:metal-responsive CopG/Arc/MetJ family transcriptional regulator